MYSDSCLALRFVMCNVVHVGLLQHQVAARSPMYHPACILSPPCTLSRLVNAPALCTAGFAKLGRHRPVLWVGLGPLRLRFRILEPRDCVVRVSWKELPLSEYVDCYVHVPLTLSATLLDNLDLNSRCFNPAPPPGL
jgi:hypothetical protein